MMSSRLSRTALVISVTVFALLPAQAAAVSDSQGGANGTTTSAMIDPDIVVDAANRKFALYPTQLGVNMDKWFNNAQGLWDPTTQQPNPTVKAKATQAGVGLLRFPGGTPANLFKWKRSVGATAQRGCQIIANDDLGTTSNNYGPAEFGKTAAAIGAKGLIMVPFANGSPSDAADWVEYMNAPVGTNPNGGTAWADVRSAQGHPTPFGITRWEIGNEHDRDSQGYWMSSNLDTRLAQYIDGDEVAISNQALGRDCDFTATTSNGQPGQTFYLRYGLIKAGTAATITVGTTTWTPVTDFSTAGPSDQVYVLDRQDGSVKFGNGVQGAIPPSGQAVKTSYTLRHEGFVAMYDAMKNTAAQIGTGIDVCSSWAPVNARNTAPSQLGLPSFPAAMTARNMPARYDCAVIHPYTNFNRDFGDAWDSPAEGHNDHMLGDEWAETMMINFKQDVDAHSVAGTDGEKAFTVVTELGALWLGGQNPATFPNYYSSVSHAQYMASQWIHNARRDVRWSIGNTLLAEPDNLRSTLGGTNWNYVYSAEAITREAMKPVFATGAQWVASEVLNQPFIDVTEESGSYKVLVVGASIGADGALRIVVVNRRLFEAQIANVVPNGFVHEPTVEVATVTGNRFDSYNDDAPGGGDDSVTLSRTTRLGGTGTFSHTFPPSSTTVLTLRPA